MKKRGLLIPLAFFLLIITVQSGAGNDMQPIFQSTRPVSLDKETYSPGEEIVISINSEDVHSITVSSGKEEYRFIGNPNRTLAFTPAIEGQFTVKALDRNSNLIDEARFVSEKKIQITTAKNQYLTGEKVLATIRGSEKSGLYTITIQFPQGSYQYFGIPEGDTIQFTPQKPGQYTVRVQKGEKYVAATNFNVTEDSNKNEFDQGQDAVFTVDLSPMLKGKRNFIHNFLGFSQISSVNAYVRGESSLHPIITSKGSDIFEIRIPYNRTQGSQILIIEAYSGQDAHNSTINFSWKDAGPNIPEAKPVQYAPYVNYSFGIDEKPTFMVDLSSKSRQRNILDIALKRATLEGVTAYIERHEKGNITTSIKHQESDNFTIEVSAIGKVKPDVYRLAVIGKKGDEYDRKEILFNWGITNITELADKLNSNSTELRSFKFDIKNRDKGERNALLKVYRPDTREKVKETTSEDPSIIEKGQYDVDMDFSEAPIQRIRFRDINLQGTMDLGIDDVDHSSRLDAPQYLKWKKVYALDPSTVNFSNATVTALAEGTQLFKCKEWNPITQSCGGEWAYLMDLTPGQEYSFDISAADPGYGETIPIPVNWYNESLGGEQIKIMICNEPNCRNTSTNFQPNDIVYLQMNTSPADIGISTNTVSIYPGSSTTALITTAWNCTNNTGADYGMCYTNFTVQSDWAGWYYINSQTRGGTGNVRHNFENPITVGTEPVTGFSMRFYRDSAYTIEGDTFNSSEIVYVEFITGSASSADASNTEPTILNFHQGAVGGNPETETFSSTTDPFRFNFSMPSLSNGYWYVFEPRLRDAANVRIPLGTSYVHGRLIRYQTNQPVNITNYSTDSPDTNPGQINTIATFFSNFSDKDDVDRHKLLVCQNYTKYSNYTCNGTTICSTDWKLGTSLNCTKTLSLSDPANQTAFLIVCDVRSNCSTNSLNWGVFKDTTFPKVNLNLPEDGNISITNSITFNYTPSDNGLISNCSIWTNESGSFSMSAMNASEITNNTNNYITKSFNSNGEYKWNIECTDTYMNSAFNSTNRTIIIDAPPIVSLMLPSNNTWKTTNNISFMFNVSSPANISNCSLIIDGIINTTNTTVSLNTPMNFSAITIQDESYNWSINCTTIYNDTGTSEQWIIKVDSTPPTISFATPNPVHDGYENDSYITLNISFTEANPDKIRINLSDQIYTYSVTGNFLNTSLSLDDGDFNLTAEINDTAGNTASTPTILFHVETSTAKTYNDTTYTAIKRTFGAGGTVFGKMTNASNSSNYTVEYWKPGSSGYTYRSGERRSTTDGNVTENRTFSLTDTTGTWGIRFHHNPQYEKWKIAPMSSPSTGVQTNGAAYNLAFYLINRDDSNITTTQAEALEVNLKRVDGTPTNVWGPEPPTTANGYTFDNTRGTYTRSHTPANNRLFQYRVTANNASATETNDQYTTLIESIIFTATGTQATTNNNEPSKLVIRNQSHSQASKQIQIQFEIYELDYSTEIISFSSSPTWQINATESSDYDNSGDRTTYDGTTPTYNSSTGYWESYINLTKSGKYAISVQVISGTNSKMKPKHGIMINKAAANTFLLTLGSTSVTLNAPQNGNISYLKNVNFNYTPSDASGFKNCSLFTNQSGQWIMAASNNSLINNSEPNMMNNTFQPDGVFLWNYICQSLSDTNVTADTNYTVHIDTTPPFVYLMGPVNNTKWTNSSIVDFEFNVTDLIGITECQLVANNETKATSPSITRGQRMTISANFENGDYNWSVNCSDSVGLTNTSITRNITVSAEQAVWNGTWFETSTTSCTGSTCSISLANTPDNTGNSISQSIIALTGETMTIASSPYMGGQVLIPVNTEINMSGTFYSTSTNAYGNSYATYYLYITNSSGQTLIAQYGNNATAGITMGTQGDPANTRYVLSGTNTTKKAWMLDETDKLKLDAIIYNQYAGTLTLGHEWDAQNRSLINITGFHFLGTLDTNITFPINNITLSENSVFNATCNVSCTMGSCLNTTVYMQRNTSATQWQNIGSTGNIILNGTETNTHYIGNITSNQQPSNTTFWLKSSTPSSNKIRCAAISDYSNSNGTNTTTVSISDSIPPTITLNAPSNNSYDNFTATFIFTPTDDSTIAGCDLTLDSIYNKTNAAITSGTQNTITTDTNLTEGSHNWSINCTDGSGNMNASETRTINIDNTAPIVNITAPPNSTIQSALSITFNFTAYDNTATNMSCTLYIDSRANVSDINYTNATNSNHTVEGFSGGTHYWNVTCADWAGNMNVSKTFQFNVNDTPPSLSLISPDTQYWSGTQNMTFQYQPNDDSGLKNCSLYINGELNQTNTTIAINQTNNFTVYNFPDGDYNWTTECFDASDQDAIATTQPFHVDTQKPAINLTTPIPGNISTSSTINLKFIPYDNMNTSMACNLTLNGTITDAGFSAANATETSKQQANLKDGTHYWNATCWDSALNYNTSETRNFTINQTPTLTLDSPPSGSLQPENTTFLFTISDNDGFTNCSLIIDGLINRTKGTGQLISGQNNFTAENLSAKNHTWNVLCYDNGTFTNQVNGTNRNFTVDMTAPLITLNLPEEGAYSYTGNVTFNWTASDNNDTTLQCNLTIGGEIKQNNISSSSGVLRSATVNSLTNGDQLWNVTCWDDANNINTSTETRLLKVRIGPVITLQSPSANSWDNDGNITFTYVPSSNSGEGFTNCSLYINDVFNQTNMTEVLDDGTNSFDLNTTRNGNYTWKVECYDTVNASGFSQTRVFYIDTIPPSINLSAPQNNSYHTYQIIPFSFMAQDNMDQLMGCNVTINSTVMMENLTSSNGTETSYNTTIQDGLHIWNVTCEDDPGNINTSESFFLTVNKTPEITIAYPSNKTWINITNETITFQTYDNDNLTNCSVMIGGNMNMTNTTIFNNQTNNVTLQNISEGLNEISIQCTDNGTYINTNATVPIILYVDITPPNVTLKSPIDSFWNNFTQISLNFTSTDNLAENTTCNITLNDVRVFSSINAQNNTEKNHSLSNLTDGIYTWNVTCRDVIYNTNLSETRTFNQSVTPSISLISPTNNTWTNSSNITFTYTVSDNDNISNCSLILNGTITQANYSVNKSAQNVFFETSASEGIHNWSVMCTDNGTYYLANTSVERIIKADYTKPLITLNSPADGYHSGNITIDFNFTIYDNFNETITCNLTINGTTNATANGTDSTSMIIRTGNFSDGTYKWNVTCNDTAGNINTSITRNFTVDTKKPAIMYTGKTDTDNSSLKRNHAYINFSVTEPYLHTVSLEWNRTNITIDDPSLVLALDFNNNTDTKSRYSYNIVNNSGANCSTLTEGKFGTACSFNGETSNIMINDSNSVLDIQQNLTMTAWVYANGSPSANGTRWAIFHKGGNSGLNDPGGYSFLLKNTNLTLDFVKLNAVELESSVTVTPNQWQHVALTVGGDNVSYYINGVLGASVSDDNPINSASSMDAYVGAYWYDGPNLIQHFNGSIDELRVWNRTMPPEEIMASYNAEIGKHNGTQNYHINMTSLQEGNYSYYIFSNDTVNNRNTSAVIRLLVDYTPPNISLDAPTPADNSTMETNSIYTNATINETNEYSAHIDLNRSLVLWLRFDEGSGTNASDTSSWGNNANLTGFGCYTENCNFTSGWTSSGKRGKAISFDGQNDNLTINSTPQLDITRNITLEAWVKIDFYKAANVIEKGGCGGYAIKMVSDGKVEFRKQCGSDSVASTSGVLGLFKWHHIAGVRNETGATLYIDGVQAGQDTTFSDFANSSNLTVGAGTDGHFKGMMDEVKVWNRALRQEEINASFMAGIKRFEYNLTGLGAGNYSYKAIVTDAAGNLIETDTRNFVITEADLQLHEIIFNTTTFIELQPVLITLNISNTGSINSMNATVGLWNNSDTIQSLQINLSSRTNKTINATWNPPLGIQLISASVDPLDTVKESNETNNNASTNTTIPLWHTIYGNVSATYLLSVNGSRMIEWNVTEFMWGNLYSADSDSTVSWQNLTAIGINGSGSNSTLDFEEMDTAMGTENLTDSINRTFTYMSKPIMLESFSIFKVPIQNIPVTNSTNSTKFITGMLWDASDTNPGEYNGSQDIVFISNINRTTEGKYGTYNFEMKIPSKLRAIKGPEKNSVTFYIELI